VGLLSRLWISLLQIRKDYHYEKTVEERIDDRNRKPKEHQPGKLRPKHFKRHYEENHSHARHKIRKQRISELAGERIPWRIQSGFPKRRLEEFFQRFQSQEEIDSRPLPDW
jgi:hypothetical protein